jgi:hypothetical protein
MIQYTVLNSRSCYPHHLDPFTDEQLYRVSIKSFPDYKHLLQENYVEYKHIFFNVIQFKKFFLQLTSVMVKKYDVFLTVHHSISLF